MLYTDATCVFQYFPLWPNLNNQPFSMEISITEHISVASPYWLHLIAETKREQPKKKGSSRAETDKKKIRVFVVRLHAIGSISNHSLRCAKMFARFSPRDSLQLSISSQASKHVVSAAQKYNDNYIKPWNFISTKFKQSQLKLVLLRMDWSCDI